MKLPVLSALHRGVLALALLALSAAASAQEQRALLIGIDLYQPPAGVTPENDGGRIDFPDLDGCKNDALAIKSLITRYKFAEANIRELYDRSATRDSILFRLNQLLADSKRGDVALFYYAGHGSQMKNSVGGEDDGRDESMVPSNTWEKGVSDIRDKELARIFNQFIDKGVKLTVIFDCCHSGSMSRGVPVYKVKSRYIAASNYDVKDASRPTPPENRPNSGFLIFSAAQDNEFAQEQMGTDSLAHGAFTVALLQAIQLHSIDVPVTTLYQTVREILKSNGKRQEPVLTGSAERQRQNLFGVPASKLSDDLLLPASPGASGRVTLRGGLAFGLGLGNELVKVNNEGVKLRIVKLIGMGESEAELVSGKISDVEAGSLFRVTNWVSNTGPLLKIYLPASVSFTEAQQLATVAAEVRRSPKVKWVSKIEEQVPDVSVFYLNGKWMVESADYPAPRELGAFTAANIIKAAQGPASKIRALYVELPPATELVRAVESRFKDYRNLQLVSNASAANYLVYGTVSAQGLPGFGLKRMEVSLSDSLSSMPLRTDYFPAASASAATMDAIADSLFGYALRLGKVRGWLLMATPRRASNFPYHLELVNAATNKVVDSVDHIGDELNLRLVANPDYLDKSVPPKFIYVFAIDKAGTMTLLFPRAEAGSVDNKFPLRDANDRLQASKTLIEGIQIVPPSGTDNYFCLASEVPLNNYQQLFTQEGVNDGVMRGEPASPLSQVIDMGNVVARGPLPPTPANWNLVRLSVKTRYK